MNLNRVRIEAAALKPAATKGPSCSWSISKAKEAFVLQSCVVRAALASVVAIRGDQLSPTACKDSAGTKKKKKKVEVPTERGGGQFGGGGQSRHGAAAGLGGRASGGRMIWGGMPLHIEVAVVVMPMICEARRPREPVCCWPTGMIWDGVG